jgi:hypothetical protein
LLVVSALSPEAASSSFFSSLFSDDVFFVIVVLLRILAGSRAGGGEVDGGEGFVVRVVDAVGTDRDDPALDLAAVDLRLVLGPVVGRELLTGNA